MSTIRSFVAVDLSPEVIRRAQGLIDVLRAAGSDTKWVSPQNMHLTLQFLGDVPPAKIATVCAAVAQAAQTHAPLAIAVQGAGAFPQASRPRTVWLGVGDGRPALNALQQAIEASLAQLGFRPEDRDFHPHLTLGRVRGGGPSVRELARLLSAQRDYDAGTCSIESVAVYASHLDRSGPTYEELGRAPLAPTSSPRTP
jgi:2'-5' RNA ligase